jgi:hypothetical protein
MTKYWFRKRKGLFTKDLGYGWMPISWEGWLLVIVFLALVVTLTFIFDLYDPKVENIKGVYFGISMIVSIIIFAIIAKIKSRD